MKKKICAITLSAVLAGSACAVAACDFKDNADDKKAYVSLDINPAIELIVDKNEKVVSVRGENEDGQVLLYGETGIEGEKIDAAIRKITDLAVQYGYLDENNKVVDTLVSSGDNGFAADILNKVDTTITATAANSGLSVTTDGEGAYSLIRKMNEVKKQFPNNKAIQNMTVQKFKLALSVSETGEISIDAAAELDDGELIGMLNEANSKIEEFATAAYREAKTKAVAAYDGATELAAYGVYAQYYIEKMLSHPLTAYYGGVYQIYASAAKGFDVICDVAALAANISRYPLDEAQINAVAQALGMESADALRNSDGEITVESIEAYADKLFKNTPASEALEKTKAALDEALSKTESVIKEKVKEMSAEYKPQIESAIESARKISDSVESLTAAMPESIRNVLGSATADLKEILAETEKILNDGNVDLDELRDAADKLDKKAKEYLKKIESDLSEDELKEIEERKAKAIEKLSDKKAEFEKALDEAAKEAKAYLSSLKEARKTK